jgi:hypothetical protein
MGSDVVTHRNEGITLRQAAVTAGLGYLVMPVSYAEFHIMPRLVIAGNIEQTVKNISDHGSLFVAAILCYLVTFLSDVVIGWALYYLMAPVNRALSLLTAVFRWVYTGLALVAVLNLVTVDRLVHSPQLSGAFGGADLNAQVALALNSFRSGWMIALLIFGIHLVLLGWLIFRSIYIPRILGILLTMDGVAWVVDSLQPFIYPQARLGFLYIVFMAELVLMIWLLARGWKIKEPVQA